MDLKGKHSNKKTTKYLMTRKCRKNDSGAPNKL